MLHSELGPVCDADIGGEQPAEHVDHALLVLFVRVQGFVRLAELIGISADHAFLKLYMRET